MKKIWIIAACVCVSTTSARASGWFGDTTLNGQIEGGIMANPARPTDGENFGQLLADHANQPSLNQITLTFTKPVDPIGGGYGLGVNLRLLYGSDARIYNIAGISDRAFNSRYQIMPVFANVALHMPWLTQKGLDGQVGIFTAPMGVETLDPSTRPFYTLAYTTEYSTPFEHVGAMFQWHLDDHYDIQFGIDTGNQTTFGRKDDNAEPAGYIGLTANNLLDGKLSLTYLTRLGPEDSVRALGPSANSAMRIWNDLNGNYKITDKLTAYAEFNFLHDEGLRAETYSAVTWLAWNVTPSLTLNYRGEIYRDNSGLMVTQFLSDTAYAKALLGDPARTENAPATTYGSLSLNAAWHPTLGHHIKFFQIRPEIRFDRSLNGTSPFNDFRNDGMFTFGGDVTLGF
ncbi:outer membrane beta-barrel protein [Kozakia baliensis]|uniref:outer membrane beta-barrel protein n=1 Tax=Kozakia baliensis TaxID=153496 RepID=UPI0038D210D0